MRTEGKRRIAAPRCGRRVGFMMGLLAVVGGPLLAGCNRGGGGAAPAATGPDGKPAPAKATVIPVTVVTARAQPVSDTAAVTGTLDTQQDVIVGAKLAGRLAAVYPREGDRVTAGQAVAQQDTGDYQAQLDQADAALESARTRLTQSEAALRSARAVYASSQTSLRLAERQTASAVANAQAGLVSAQESAKVVRQGARAQERASASEAVEAAKANRESARADLVKARADLKRYQALYREQAVAAQQLDQAQSVADASQSRFTATEAAVNQAQQALNLIQEGNRPEDIRRAESGVEQARQALITAQANRGQVELRRSDITNAQAGIASAQAAVETARAGVRQAEATVRLARLQLKVTTLYAPISGIVAERRAEPGTQLGAGGAVLRIVGLGQIYYDARVSETQYAGIRIGQAVTVRVDALPGRAFRGRVKELLPLASADNRTFTVRVTLPNEGGALRPGTFARGDIVLATRPAAIIVPRDAVLDFDGKAGRVFVVENGTARERKVRVGLNTVLTAEILDGVRAGEQVVTTGSVQLQDGSKVSTDAPAPPQSAQR